MISPNEFIRDYKVISKLGEGGMGSVWLAEDTLLDRNVALKILNPVLTQEAHFTDRFKLEAKMQASLIHPNIISLHTFFEDSGSYYMVLEYAPGTTLTETIKQNVSMDETRIKFIFQQILDGVGFAHQKGIIHRDIKPSNIMLDANDNVKIMDFGIAKVLGDRGMTKTGTKIGTIYYMSPEQVRAEKDIDQRTDIYSLGIVLYEMLTSKLPFNMDIDSDYELMNEIVQGSIGDPRELRQGLSEQIVSVMQKMIEKNKEDRYTTCYQCGVELTNGISRSEAPKIIINQQPETSKQKTVTEPRKSSFEKNKEKTPANVEQKQKESKVSIELKAPIDVLNTNQVKKGSSRIKIAALIISLILIASVSLSFIFDINLFSSKNEYQISEIEKVRIGSQTWMQQNLGVDHYRNGDLIPEVRDSEEWEKLNTGAWCYYNNDPENGKKYGKLYNWYAVNDPRGLAPDGWHIPKKEEFETIISVVMNNGNSLKAIGEGIENGIGTNNSGFSALISGARGLGNFNGLGIGTAFWTSTEGSASEAFVVGIDKFGSSVGIGKDSKKNGFSLRCLKDK